MIGADELLLLGVVAIYALHRVTRWMHRRGWIQWKPRGTSSSLGNAVLAVQTIFQPQYREVLESRLEEPDEREASGDPPNAGLRAQGSKAQGLGFRLTKWNTRESPPGKPLSPEP